MRIKNTFLLFVLTLIITSLKCTNNNPANSSTTKNPQSTKKLAIDPAILKIYVNENGNVKLNGEYVSLERLDIIIDSNKSNVKSVYYSRYNAQEYEGPKESLQVLGILIKYRLPLMFYTDSTFSQVAKMD
jgi:hypothetical protein